MDETKPGRARLILAFFLVAGCGASVEDPTVRESIAEPGPGPEPRSQRIQGSLKDVATGAPIRGSLVCAGSPYSNHCGKTDPNGRYDLAPINGFSAAEIVFLSAGYPDAWTQVPLIDGGASFDGRLPVAEAWARLSMSVPSAPSAAALLVRPQSSDGTVVPGVAVRVTDLEIVPGSGEIREHGELSVACADGNGELFAGTTTLEGDGFCVAFDPTPGYVRVSVPRESRCRLPAAGGELVESRTFQSDARLLTLLPLSCDGAEGAN